MTHVQLTPTRAQDDFAKFRSRGVDVMPWPGGTWAGRCGAAHYFDGPPTEIQTYTERDQIRRYQVWASQGKIGGHYAECRLRRHHQGLHQGAGRVWARSDLMQNAAGELA